MAVVGEADILVRAITNRVKPDIERAFSGLDQIGTRAGNDAGNGLRKGVRNSLKGDLFAGKFREESAQAARALSRLIEGGFILGPVISGLVSGIGSLGATLVTLSTALSRAAPAAIVLVGALSALAQAAITAKIAFGGVFKAIGASDKATGSSLRNTRALERAQKRINDLKAEYQKTLEFETYIFPRYEEAARRIIDAEDNLADARASLIRTNRAYQRAQSDAADAQKDVTEAREEAREALQQLRFELEGGAISEKRARLEFEKARESLQRVQDLPPNSRARQEAELAFAEAELNLRKAIDRNGDLRKEEAAATAAGVEGSERVQNALRAQADAATAVTDAEEDLAREQRDLLKLEADVAKVREENSEDAVLAQIKKERKELKDAIKEAEENLEDLKKSAGGAPSALQEALKDLSPEAREFVMFIRDEFKPALKELRDEAGKLLFPKLITALTTIKDDLFPALKPLLRDTGGLLGDIAIDLSEVVTKGENISRLERIWKTNDKLIGNFGAALGSIYEVLLILLDAARPVIEEFGDWIEQLAGNWASDAEKNFDTIQERFQDAAEIIKTFARIFGNLFDGFGEIGKAVTEGGALDFLLDFFETGSEKFAEFTKSANEDGSLGKYFLDATKNGTKILSLITNIIAEILKLGDDEGVGQFADKLSTAVDIFGEIGETVNEALPAFGDFIIELANLIKNLTESESLKTYFNVLTEALKIVNDILSNELVRNVFIALATFFAFSRAIRRIFRIARFLVLGFSGNLLGIAGAAKTGFGFLKSIPGRFETLRLRGMYAMDAIKKGANNVKTAATTMGSKVGNALKIAGGGIKKGATAGFAGLKTAFSTVGTAAATMGTAIKTAFTKIIGVVKTALMTIGRLLLANPWILIIVAIVAIVALIIMNWDKIKEIVGAALEWIGEKISMAWNWIVETTTNIWNGIVDFFKSFGGKVLSAIGDLATTVLDFINKYHPIMVVWRLISENWETISTFFTELPGKILEFIGNLATTVLDFINKYHPIIVVWRLIRENWDTIKAWFKNLPGRIKDAISALSTTVVDFINRYHPIAVLFRKVKEAWPAVRSWFSQKMTDIVNFIKELPQKIRNAAKGMWDGIKDAFKSAVNFIIRGWNRIEFKIPGFQIGPIGYDGFTLGLPDIPELAKGGVVKPSAGGTLARIAEAGKPERIEPLDENGLSKRDKALIAALTTNGSGGGATINVYPSEGMNERELAQKVSRELASMMRKGAA